jgi:aerobic carbon-monoxide dehydrogenase medium subunit
VRPFAFAAASSLDEAHDLLGTYGDEAHLLAGGTSFVLLLNQGLIEPGVVIGLSGIRNLHGVRVADGSLEIGALTALRRIESDPAVREHAPALADAVARVATVRVRNQATLGGNLVHADPAQDPPPMLLAHDAEVVLAGPSASRTVPLTDFFVDVFETAIRPDEILTTIRLPVPPVGARFEYVKFLPRTVDDYATVSVAVRVDPGPDGTIGDVRIALGSAGPVPFRALDAEAVLRGRQPAEALIDEAAALARDATDPVDDVRGSAAYKREMAGLWTGRALRRLLLAQGAVA